jgi:hypothetical protein
VRIVRLSRPAHNQPAKIEEDGAFGGALSVGSKYESASKKILLATSREEMDYFDKPMDETSAKKGRGVPGDEDDPREPRLLTQWRTGPIFAPRRRPH